MRKSYVQVKTDDGYKFVDKAEIAQKDRGLTVIGDLDDFVSPVTREVIHGRAGLRKHMREHNLAHADDFKEHWKTKAKERANHSKSRSERNSRIEALKHAVEKHDGR